MIGGYIALHSLGLTMDDDLDVGRDAMGMSQELREVIALYLGPPSVAGKLRTATTQSPPCTLGNIESMKSKMP